MDALNLLYTLQVTLGIGLVIFVHEAGHFIAARLCGVRVEVFSLGFGPRLFGWKRGSTHYQLALLPLGGYCKMAGEEPQEEGEQPPSDDLRSKSVGQRFLIYSGGVIMNVIFAMLVFPAILFYGVPFTPPVVGETVPGGPAWHAGIEPGTEVLSVNGHPTIGFMYIAHHVALGPPDVATLEVLAPGASEPTQVLVRPRYDDLNGFSSISVSRPLDEDLALEVKPESPAFLAGLRSGDQLLSIETALPELGAADQMRLAYRDSQAIDLRVQRGAEQLAFSFAPTLDSLEPRQILGVGPLLNQVIGLRANPVLDDLGLREDDRLQAVNGRPILRAFDLQLGLADVAGPLVLSIVRNGRQLDLTGPALERAEALALAHDIALGPDFDSARVTVTPRSAAAAAGLQDGDQLIKIDNASVDVWSEVQEHTRLAAREDRAMLLDVRRAGPEGQHLLQITAATAPWSSPDYGFGIRSGSYIYRAGGLREAVTVGVQGSWKFLVDAWNTVKSILLGQVSGKNMGGIIAISVVSYSWASMGLAKLLFFLCMLSMNLAFLNVLPIPVLDGGHLMFLLIEKITGSPVSERVFGYSQMVGMVLILSLMIYVTYNDLVRFVPSLFGG